LLIFTDRKPADIGKPMFADFLFSLKSIFVIIDRMEKMSSENNTRGIV